MIVNSISKAWQAVNEIFPTDYIKDENSSARAGYPVYRSTADGHYYDYICDLGNRLEVNLSDGRTINICIQSDDPAPKKSTVVKATISVGLNDRETKTQLVNTDAAEDYIADVIADEIGFGTIYRTKGVYKHDDGHTVKENTIVIVIDDIDRTKALKLSEQFARKFNQESVAVEFTEVEFNLVKRGEF